MSLYFTEYDHHRLNLLLSQAVGTSDPRLRGQLGRLNDGLQVAYVVRPQDMPADIVTINSRLLIEDLDDGIEETWQLCLPDQASISDQRISVLAPLGMALLGARAGQVVTWKSEHGHGSVRVKSVLFQPEAAGQYHL